MARSMLMANPHSTAHVGMLIFTGWEGWEMVYRGRVGVLEQAEGGAKEAAPHRQSQAR